MNPQFRKRTYMSVALFGILALAIMPISTQMGYSDTYQGSMDLPALICSATVVIAGGSLNFGAMTDDEVESSAQSVTVTNVGNSFVELSTNTSTDWLDGSLNSVLPETVTRAETGAGVPFDFMFDISSPTIMNPSMGDGASSDINYKVRIASGSIPFGFGGTLTQDIDISYICN